MWSWLNALGNPARFAKLAVRLVPIFTILAVILLGMGLYMSFFTAPPDYQQGETVRIMFIHVPSASLAMFIYMIMVVSALGTLVWRHPMADVAAKTAAPLGAVFSFLVLVTGALWGKPSWGTYWVWDARLTSMLILLLMYLGLIALWRAIDNPTRAARLCAVLILVGVINIPIIKFSVDWWSTLHQPASLFRKDGPSIDPSMLIPLLVMFGGMFSLFFALHFAAMHVEVRRRHMRQLERKLAAQAGG